METPKKIFRGIYALVVGFSEAMTVSFYKNVKRHYRGKPNKYRELKVPKDYKDSKLEPEYKELGGGYSSTDSGNKGIPGMGLFD